MAERIGALGGLGKEDFQTLSQGLQSGNNPIANVYGFDVKPQDVLTTAVGVVPQISAPLALGSMISDYKVNQLANQALNRPTDFLSNLNKQSIKDLRSEVDVNKDRNITNTEVQNYGMKKGLTAYDVGINPLQGYKPGNIKRTNITNVDPTGLGVNTGAVGSYGDLGGATGSGYKGSKGVFLGFGRAEGVNPSQSEQTGDQTSIKDTSKGKDLSNTFADDAASASDDGGTYICTALYDMGDMKAYIYKYDQLYGRKVNPLTYKGYCLWGKYVATKIKRQGWTYRIVKPIALAWAKQMAYDLSKGRHGKNSKFVKALKIAGEGICYGLGLITKIKFKKGELYGKH
jgi:hypothetical protein